MTRPLLTLKKLKEIIRERGGEIVLREDGVPVLRGLGHAATSRLMAVLPFYREQIIKEMKNGNHLR